MRDHRAPRWLPGGHAQTIWTALRAHRGPGLGPHARLTFARERWTTPDGDFVDVDRLDPPASAGAPARPLLALFHGLEGSSASSYAQAFADAARRQGRRFALPHFRGCSGEINVAPRAYHSGDFEEVGWMLARLRAREPRPIVAVGVSLGGNALLRWAEEAGGAASQLVAAVAAVSAPLDLAAGGNALGRGVNRAIYNRMFLATLVPKARAKLAQHPGLFDGRRLAAARTIRDFDDAFTAPVHGFRDAADYWARASAGPQLRRIEIPALVLNAANDPFIPASSLPEPGRADVGRAVTLWRPSHGGHVGFAAGGFPGRLDPLADAVLQWLDAAAR